jgi:hypothetical protein
MILVTVRPCIGKITDQRLPNFEKSRELVSIIWPNQRQPLDSAPGEMRPHAVPVGQSDELVFHREACRRAAPGYFQFLVNRSQVCVDSARADHQLLGNLWIS